LRVFNPELADVTASAAGTVYFSSNPAVALVSAEGLVTATGLGNATITVIHGPAQRTVSVRVVAPAVGPIAVGPEGRLVASADGALVAIAPAALGHPTTVSVSPLTLDQIGL